MKRILLLISIVFCGFLTLQAQNTCTEQLRITQRSFDEGLLDDIPMLLADCMKDGFTKEEKANAYKLLIQTYLFSEEIQKADEVMIQFLTEFPSYKLAVNDPKEFINLYQTYRTTPIFKLELLAGGSFTIPQITQPYGSWDIVNVHPDYKVKTGYTFELNYINSLYRNFNYSAGVSLTLSNFGYINKPYDYSTVTADFSNMYVGLPLAVRYNYEIGRLFLFVKTGFEPVYLINSSVDIIRTDDIIGREPITATESLINQHIKADIRPFLFLGTKLDLGRDQIMISVGYKFSTMNQLNEDKLYSNLNLLDKYNFAEDNMLLNQAVISFSYIRPIYKPKKIR
jgi:hypothetical protein